MLTVTACVVAWATGAPVAVTLAAMQLGAPEPAGPATPLTSLAAGHAWYVRRYWMQVLGVVLGVAEEPPVKVMVCVTLTPVGMKAPGEAVLTSAPRDAWVGAPELPDL